MEVDKTKEGFSEQMIKPNSHLYKFGVISHICCNHVIDLLLISPVPVPLRYVHKDGIFSFVAVFLGCTSTGRVGLWSCGSMSRNT